jgi:hypothetical protein
MKTEKLKEDENNKESILQFKNLPHSELIALKNYCEGK